MVGINSQRSATWVRLVLPLLLSGIASTASAQSALDPSSWHLHQDTVTGISFRYPPEWQLVAFPCPPDDPLECLMEAQLLLPPPSEQKPYSYLPAVTVIVQTCSASSRSAGFRCAANDEAVLKSCERFQVGNAEGFECIDYFEGGGCVWSAVVPLDGRQILIATPHLDEQDRKSGTTKEECTEQVIARRNTLPLKEVFASFSIPLPSPS
jgi:hypothetical protein